MALDITKGVHKKGFLSKLLSTYGGAHIHNVTLGANHDNFDLIGLVTTKWNSFDNYDEDTSASIDFEGRIMGGLNSEGCYYIQVEKADGVYLVYNTPESVYTETEFQDETLFFNEEGDTAEAIELHYLDIFAVSPNGFTGTPADGAAVTYSDGKFVVAGASI